MRICILQPFDEDQNPIEALDYALVDLVPLIPTHQWKHERLRQRTLNHQLEALLDQEIDVFVNLCDASETANGPGIEVVRFLEKHNLAFTGACSKFFEPSRVEMKQAAENVDVRFPKYAVATQESDWREAADLRFPLIVKHPASYGSVGLSRESRVIDIAGLQQQTRRMVKQFGGALIEEFIDGREFTVLVTEPPLEGDAPLVFQPIECLLGAPDECKHYHRKFVDYKSMVWRPVVDQGIASQLMLQTAGIFSALNGSGYARIDFRMDSQEQLFFLEINPQCGIFYPREDSGSADMILEFDGFGQARFLSHIIMCAIRRQKRLRS